MIKKEVIINGNNFSNLKELYDEVEKVLTKNLDWKIGRNLDAFDDILEGGFGLHEYKEPVRIIWKNSKKSKEDLGHKETVKYLRDKLKNCHPTAIESVQKEIKLSKKNKDKTLFDRVLDIIRDHDHIELILE